MVDGGQETRGSSYLLLLPAFALVYLAIATAVLLSLAQTYSFPKYYYSYKKNQCQGRA